jgi:hypothetical protein
MKARTNGLPGFSATLRHFTKLYPHQNACNMARQAGRGLERSSKLSAAGATGRISGIAATINRDAMSLD